MLNLLTKEYKILTVQDKKIKEYKLDLVGLKKELEKMKLINDKIWSYLTDELFN